MEKLLLLRNDDALGKRNFNDEKYYLIRLNIREFFKSLVEKAEKDGFDTDQLLEKPDALGHTVFGIASNTSQDIIKYILSSDHRRLNTHWRMFHRACQPCAVRYDVIGKYETMQSDLDYVLDRLGVKLDFPRKYQH